jgi:triosephosphate isomerase
MSRKFFVGGNWKMNGTKTSIDEIIKFLNEKGINPNTGKLNATGSQLSQVSLCQTYRVLNSVARYCTAYIYMIADNPVKQWNIAAAVAWHRFADWLYVVQGVYD